MDAVAAKLKDLNPGFDGKVTPKLDEGGVVREVTFAAVMVKNFTPLRALPGLRTINGQPAAAILKESEKK